MLEVNITSKQTPGTEKPGAISSELEAAPTIPLHQRGVTDAGSPVPKVSDDPLIGTLFEGKYRIESKIGEGGMGAVYRATHIFMERPVAIKFLHGDRTTDTAAIERFKVEARAAGRIQHPHATAVTDFGVTSDNIFYLVMEYLEGRSLRERIKVEGVLPLDETVRIMAQACDAVEAAHKRGIVHRDLKPDNIFLQREDNTETVKVLDFGIAKLTQGGANAGLTSTGMIVGTPYYMSPEQCQGDQLDQCADIYSLGVIVFEMVTGKLPFTADSPLSIVLKHVSEPPPSPRKFNPALPEALEAVILKALSKRKQDRQQSAMQLAEELSKAVGFNVNIHRRTGILVDDNTASTQDLDAGTRDDKPSRGTQRINERGASTEVILDADTELSIKKAGNTPVLKGARKTALIGARPASGDEIDETVEYKGGQITTTTNKMPIYLGLGVLTLVVVLVVGYFATSKTRTTDPIQGSMNGNNSGQTTGSDTEGLIQMVSIPGNTFIMGRDPGIDPNFDRPIRTNETPANEVTVASFSISKYEVTNAQYAVFVKETGHRSPAGWNGSSFPKGADDLPVTSVTWTDAVEFCKWLSKKEGREYRLPTEEEWEFAARGPDSNLFPWGPTFEPNRANSKELGETLLSVKSDSMKRDSSPFGVIGMAGNVSEWTSSDYKAYRGNTTDRPRAAGNKVMRGGNYKSDNWVTPATFRFDVSPDFSSGESGFRVARDGIK